MREGTDLRRLTLTPLMRLALESPLLYREDFGRPSVPPSQLAVALLLQAHDSVSDVEAIAHGAE